MQRVLPGYVCKIPCCNCHLRKFSARCELGATQLTLNGEKDRDLKQQDSQEDAAAKLFKLSQPRFYLNGNLPVDHRVLQTAFS